MDDAKVSTTVSGVDVDDAASVGTSRTGGVDEADESGTLLSVDVEDPAVIELWSTGGVVDAVEPIPCVLSTITTRAAVPVFPAPSVALYVIVCVPATVVSRTISPYGVEVAPSSDA